MGEDYTRAWRQEVEIVGGSHLVGGLPQSALWLLVIQVLPTYKNIFIPLKDPQGLSSLSV